MPSGAHAIDCIDYDFSANEAKARSLVQRFGFLEVAVRQNDLAWEVRDYLREHPRAAVANLGCGLDSTGRACDNDTCLIYNLDFPDVIEVREQLLPAGERERNIVCNLNYTSWFSEIDDSDGAVFFASGVFYYFLAEQVRSLVCSMAERFAGGRLVFDAANRMAVKMITKTWLKEAEIKERPVPGASTLSYKGKPLTYMPLAYEHPTYWKKIEEETKGSGDIERSTCLSKEKLDVHLRLAV